MDIERLRNDPAYWDRVAPEGAEVYIIDGDGVIGPAFYYHDGRVWQGCHPGAGFWTAIDHDYLEVIPRPSQPQWRGPEDGLPPVGLKCEARDHREVGPDWVKCTVVAHLLEDGDTDVIFQTDTGWDWHSYPSSFRPLKSDKERAVDAAMNTDPGEDLGPCSRRQFCEGLYDAGFLRLPEDTQ